MKLVMTKSEVAETLALSVEELTLQMAELERLGFPAPLAGLGERWSILDLMKWIRRDSTEGRGDSAILRTDAVH